MKAQHFDTDGTVSALDELCYQNENAETRGQANDISDATQLVSFLSFIHFWKEVLTESHDVHKYLQQKGLSVENCAQNMKAFVVFLSDGRDALAAQPVDNAIRIC